MSTQRLSSASVRARKGKPFAMVTAYDAAFARIAETAGIDCLLVGDSLGMVVLGYENTAQVELADMLRHTAAVARGTHAAHIVADLPFGSYQMSDHEAIASSVALIKAGASAVKLEGGRRAESRIAAIVNAGIPVMAHLGVLPQTASLERGFRRRRERDDLIADIDAITEAGAYAVVLEMVDHELAAELTARVMIPTIGIGSGVRCDAQVLVMHDMLGLYHDSPPFATRYADLGTVAETAFRAFGDDVKKTSSTPT